MAEIQTKIFFHSWKSRAVNYIRAMKRFIFVYNFHNKSRETHARHEKESWSRPCEMHVQYVYNIKGLLDIFTRSLLVSRHNFSYVCLYGKVYRDWISENSLNGWYQRYKATKLSHSFHSFRLCTSSFSWLRLKYFSFSFSLVGVMIVVPLL